MINDLTQPVSKRLLLLILLVTVGSEVVLYLSRYTYFFTEIYESIMIIAIFVAWRLQPRLAGSSLYSAGMTEQSGNPETSNRIQPSAKRRFISHFAAGFLLFYLGAMLTNFYSNILFEDFNENYQEYVEDSADAVDGTWVDDDGEEIDYSSGNPVLDWFDMAGYEFLSDAMAGFEEVYRLGYMVLFLMILKKILPRRWETGRQEFFLMPALFLSSILFGIGHALDTPQSWSVAIGTVVTFTNMGLILGVLLLWTRNLWAMIAVHSTYDILMSVEWFYYEYAGIIFSAVMLLVWIIETATRKTTEASLPEAVTVNLEE